jgi:general secretion pathway protein E
LSYAFARDHGVVVLDPGPPVRVGMRPDASATALLEVRRLFGAGLELVTLEPQAFEAEIARSYAISAQATRSLADDVGTAEDLDSLASGAATTADLLDGQDDAPVIRLINGLIGEAIRHNASDIHIDPYESHVGVRLRVDGELREVLRIGARAAPRLVSRVKVMARLDIAERRLPQDGRLSVTLGGRTVDVRVATLPARGGERVVMRLLDRSENLQRLEQLGLAPAQLGGLRRALGHQHGIVLVTGPTGSGKTTTLYAALGQLNDGTRSILTIEDPVEYGVDGISQTQVNARIGMTFATGLRAILRHDPNVIMIGEIRDAETARIAVQASLTGHLVLSSVHTNDAVGAITRLRDMGIEPYLLASTLRCVLAQRLVRRLCPHCRQPTEPGPAQRALLDAAGHAGATVYEPAGCASCGGTGYTGRVGIHELVEIDADLRRMIHDQAPEDLMTAHIRRGSQAILDAGLTAAAHGVTSLSDVLRTCGPDAVH